MDYTVITKELAELNEKKGVNLKGKKYTQVVDRVDLFRKHFGYQYGLITEIIFTDGGALAQARVLDEQQCIIASGHAFTSNISAEKSIEKTESVAIGRCMAALGISGGEYSTSDEINSWQDRYQKPVEQKITPVYDDEFDIWIKKIEQCSNLEMLQHTWNDMMANRARLTDHQLQELIDAKDAQKFHIEGQVQNV